MNDPTSPTSEEYEARALDAVDQNEITRAQLWATLSLVAAVREMSFTLDDALDLDDEDDEDDEDEDEQEDDE